MSAVLPGGGVYLVFLSLVEEAGCVENLSVVGVGVEPASVGG